MRKPILGAAVVAIFLVDLGTPLGVGVPFLYLLVALGASLGSCLRYLAGHYLDHVFPRGTLLVNLVGSFLLGVLAGLALDGNAMALLGTGFCGGLTTFSAFAVKATYTDFNRWKFIGNDSGTFSIGLLASWQ